LQNFSAQYGVDSLQRHCRQAHALGIAPTVCDLPGARCDINEPEDLALLLHTDRRDIAINTRNFLLASGVAERVAAMQTIALNADRKNNAFFGGADADGKRKRRKRHGIGKSKLP